MRSILFKVLPFGFLLLATLPVEAQQNPLFSHYMFARELTNPAFYGGSANSYFSAGHRTQWFGYSTTFDGDGGAPNTQFLNFSAPIQGKLAGIGINMVNDNIGPVNLMKIQTAATYKRQIGGSELVFGVAPSFNILTLNFNQLRFVDPSDPLNVGTKQSQFQPDLDLGLVYRNEDWEFGVSVQNLLEPSFNFGIADLQNNITRSYNVLASYNYTAIYDFLIVPSILVRSDLISTTFDASVMTTYKDNFWGGVSYRYAEAIILLVGYSFMEDNRIRIGYSFDYIVSNQNAKQPTSHEVFIRYNLPSFGIGAKKVIRTPRFIF